MFDPAESSDHLTDEDLYRMTFDPDVPEGWEPQFVHAVDDPDAPSCGPDNHRIVLVPVCFNCGGIFHIEPENPWEETA